MIAKKEFFSTNDNAVQRLLVGDQRARGCERLFRRGVEGGSRGGGGGGVWGVDEGVEEKEVVGVDVGGVGVFVGCEEHCLLGGRVVGAQSSGNIRFTSTTSDAWGISLPDDVCVN